MAWWYWKCREKWCLVISVHSVTVDELRKTLKAIFDTRSALMNAVSSQTFDEASSGGILSFPNCRGAWADAASPADGVTQIQTDTMTEANRNRTTRWRECFHAWFLSPPISYSFRESGTKPQTDRHPPEKTLTVETGQRLQSGCCSRFDVKRQTDKRRQVSCHSGFLPQTTTVSWVLPREHGESDWIWEWNQSELTPPDNCGCLHPEDGRLLKPFLTDYQNKSL